MAADYYDVLEVARGASPEEIKRAYRRLAHQHHPDKDGGNEEKFKEINAAYEVLSDEQKRARYDQFGHAGQAAGASGFEGFGDINDIFSQFFGGRATTSRPARPRGQDIAVDTTIDFVEAATGLKRDISLRTYQKCDRCHGNAAEPGTPIETCASCRGQGTTTITRQTMLGAFSQQTTCSNCHGQGKVPSQACRTCRGQGRVLQDRTFTVDIPPGIAAGQTLRLANQGEAAPYGGQAGDLYVSIHVRPHPNLTRDGSDLRAHLKISFADAALGTTAQVDTLVGQEPLNIPPGTQPGTELILPGRGFPKLGGTQTGDQLITVDIEIPKKLSRHQRKLLQDFKNSPRRKLFSKG